MNTCGGCRDLGAHSRWCKEVVGPRAERLGITSERVQDLADQIGSLSPLAANRLYAAARDLRAQATVEAEAWKNRNKLYER